MVCNGYQPNRLGVDTTWAVVGALVLVWALPVAAQNRRGEQANIKSPLIVELAHATQFEGALVPAGRYLATVKGAALALANPATMVVVASFPLRELPGRTPKHAATRVAVERTKKKTRIVVEHQHRAWIVEGNDATAEQIKSLAASGTKSENAIAHATPQAKTELELAERAANRYAGQVIHCADKAHQQRWGTDDERFVRCLCPIAEKWRMPKPSTTLRFHYALAKGKSGFSMTIGPDGRGSECRVWVGAKAPEELEAEQRTAQSASPAAEEAP